MRPLTLLLGCLLISTPLLAQLPSNGLEVHFDFNGNYTEHQSGVDGEPHNVTFTDGADQTPEGAILYNGSNSYVAFPQEFFDGNDAVSTSTFMVRFRADDLSTEQGLWNKDGNWRENRIRIYPDGHINLAWAYPNYYDGVGSSPGAISQGVWHTAVFILNENTGQIFIDGIETGYQYGVENSTISFLENSPCPSDIRCNRFGMVRWGGSPSRFFNGAIDEFAIWNRALTPAEIGQVSSVSPEGCTHPAACNYNSTATEDDGSCTYADYGRDCDGNCLGMTPWFVDAGSSGSEATGEPGSPFATIQDALELACPTDTIHIAAGTYSENVNITTSNLTLLGDEEFDPMGSDQTDVVIDANNAGSGLVIDAAEAHVVGLTFTNGNATHGGAVYATNSGSNSILDRCAITNNSGLDLVTSHAQNLQFDQCVVTSNSGRNTIVPWKTASFNRCRIQNNNTPDNSNAILAAGDNTQIVNCLIGPNGSKGVYAYGATLLIEHTTITGHTRGCALDAGHFGDASIYMVNSVITENDQDLVVNQTGNLLAQFHIATCILDEPLEYSWESAYSTIEEYGTNIILPALLEEDYSLASTSPGIGVAQTGLTWTGPTPNEPVIDITGAVRPQPAETSADLGAFEHPLGTPEPTFGCTDDTACNYDPAATDDDASCIAPTCDDPTACNYDAEATCGGGTCIPSGCMEEDACNYNAAAQCAGEACDYSCCPGPGCCDDPPQWDAALQQCITAAPDTIVLTDTLLVPTPSCGAGTHWDPVTEMCIADAPGTVDENCTVMNLQELAEGYQVLLNHTADQDSIILALQANLDTCTGNLDNTANNALDGPCAGENHVTYQGHNYGIIEIGDQCWFSENLDVEWFRDGSPIAHLQATSDWLTTDAAGWCYPEDASGNALETWGRLYNFWVVGNNICPSGWHIPNFAEWFQDGNLKPWYEAQHPANDGMTGGAMKVPGTQDWIAPNSGATNELGWNGRPSGSRDLDGQFSPVGTIATYHINNTFGGGEAHHTVLSTGSTDLYRISPWRGDTPETWHMGTAIRCVKN